MDVISLSGVSFAYNGRTVVNNITHQFNRGSFTAILGPNGSGKTTLIRLLGGRIMPANGQVLINGRSTNVLGARDIAKISAYVPQSHTNIFPKSVFETVLLGRNPYIRWSPGRKDKSIVADILVRLGLDDIAMKNIDQLSGGQKQRVCIARALAQHPSIILLDEPTASLDLLHQHDVLKLLKGLTQTGITIIMAIHDLNLAIKYCSDFLILENGKMQGRGDQDVFSQELIERVYKVKIKLVQESDQKYILPLDPIDKSSLEGKV